MMIEARAREVCEELVAWDGMDITSLSRGIDGFETLVDRAEAEILHQLTKEERLSLFPPIAAAGSVTIATLLSRADEVKDENELKRIHVLGRRLQRATAHLMKLAAQRGSRS